MESVVVAICLFGIFVLCWYDIKAGCVNQEHTPSQLDLLSQLHVLDARLEPFTVEWLEEMGFEKVVIEDDGAGGHTRYVYGDLIYLPESPSEYQWEIRSSWIKARSAPTKKFEVEVLMKYFGKEK